MVPGSSTSRGQSVKLTKVERGKPTFVATSNCADTICSVVEQSKPSILVIRDVKVTGGRRQRNIDRRRQPGISVPTHQVISTTYQTGSEIQKQGNSSELRTYRAGPSRTACGAASMLPATTRAAGDSPVELIGRARITLFPVSAISNSPPKDGTRSSARPTGAAKWAGGGPLWPQTPPTVESVPVRRSRRRMQELARSAIQSCWVVAS